MKGHNINIDFTSLTVRDFIGCWPDEHELLAKLLSSPGKSRHQNLALEVGLGLQNLGYEHEPELLSMHACLCDDWDAQTVLRMKDPGSCIWDFG